MGRKDFCSFIIFFVLYDGLDKTWTVSDVSETAEPITIKKEHWIIWRMIDLIDSHRH